MTRRQSLGAALRDHNPADEREAGFRDRMLELLAAEGDPFTRSHFEPGHFTASIFALSPTRREVLLIHHRFLGIWIQPGGHIESQDADIRGAALRELREECGVASSLPHPAFPGLFDLDIHEIPPNPKKGEPGHLHYDVRSAVVLLSEQVQASEEVLGARWVALDAVARGEHATDESVMRAVRKLAAT